MKREIQLGFIFSFFYLFCFAQEGVKNTSNNVSSKVKGKIMIVAFDPKMYMSDIDQSINKSTNWKFNQIREFFRHQLDNQLKSSFQANKESVVSFYLDSAKMSKDLAYIYNNISWSYDLVEKPSSPTDPIKENDKKIKNGQLTVEVSNDRKFMNTKLLNIEMLKYLNEKYTSEVFVFINQLDIITDPNSYDIKSDSYQRNISVHYTIVDKTGKLIAAGIASSACSSKVNEPKKIVAQCFSTISKNISSKYPIKAISPKTN